jgi:DNA repair ATPase RecN
MFDVSILYEQKNIKEKIEEDYNTYLQYLNKVNIIVPKYDTTLVDNISSTEEISLDYEKYCVNQASLNDLQEQLKDVNEKISEKESIINNIRVCPTCGRTLDE